MTKSDLISRVQFDTKLSMAQSKDVVQSVIDHVAGALSEGDNVTLVGFGTFKLSDRAARVGRNPRTGEAVDIPARRTVSFKAGRALKDAL
jgi:DNA-binding protein HU-beta